VLKSHEVIPWLHILAAGFFILTGKEEDHEEETEIQDLSRSTISEELASRKSRLEAAEGERVKDPVPDIPFAF
jgi:hypothetical protein